MKNRKKKDHEHAVRTIRTDFGTAGRRRVAEAGARSSGELRSVPRPLGRFAAIHDMALELGAEDIAPPERVWISLRNQLEAEGLIHELLADTQGAELRRPRLVGRFSAARRCRRFSGLGSGRASAVGYLSNSPQTAVQLRAIDASARDLLPFLPPTAFSRKKS